MSSEPNVQGLKISVVVVGTCLTDAKDKILGRATEEELKSYLREKKCNQKQITVSENKGFPLEGKLSKQKTKSNSLKCVLKITVIM